MPPHQVPGPGGDWAFARVAVVAVVAVVAAAGAWKGEGGRGKGGRLVCLSGVANMLQLQDLDVRMGVA